MTPERPVPPSIHIVCDACYQPSGTCNCKLWYGLVFGTLGAVVVGELLFTLIYFPGKWMGWW